MNSLNNRLEALEAKLNEEDLLTKLRKRQDNRKNVLLEQLYSRYNEYLKSLSLDENIENKFIEVLFYTIKYVRKNHLNIARTIELSLTDDMIQEIIVNFININFKLQEEFIIESILFVSKCNIVDVNIKEEEPITKKKHSFFKK